MTSCFTFIALAANKGYYGIRIVTGKQLSARMSDSGVYITLIGSKASSGKVYICKWLKIFSQSTSRQSYDDLLIETDQDLGEILVVILGNDEAWFCSGIGAPWFVDFVMIHNFQSKGTDEFPCYHWIGDGDSVSCTAHTSTSSVINDVWSLSQPMVFIFTADTCVHFI